MAVFIGLVEDDLKKGESFNSDISEPGYTRCLHFIRQRVIFIETGKRQTADSALDSGRRVSR
jgi:hypothetical protein